MSSILLDTKAQHSPIEIDCTSINVDGNIKINGGFQVMGMDTEVFTVAEIALIDIIPKIKDTHPDLFLKYIDLIPEG